MARAMDQYPLGFNLADHAVWYTHFGHNHNHYIAADVEEGIEGLLILLAEAMESCQPEKWKDREGYEHSHDEIQDAVKAAAKELATIDLHKEWRDLQLAKKRFAIWGKQAPSLLLQPTEDPNKWEMMVTDEQGRPKFYPVRPDVVEGLPDPREIGAKRDPIRGWKVDRRRKPYRLHRKHLR
jgi:hypothetical protein